MPPVTLRQNPHIPAPAGTRGSGSLRAGFPFAINSRERLRNAWPEGVIKSRQDPETWSVKHPPLNKYRHRAVRHVFSRRGWSKGHLKYSILPPVYDGTDIAGTPPSTLESQAGFTLLPSRPAKNPGTIV